MADIDKKTQVQAQCRVVAHLARAIAEVYDSNAKFTHPELLDMVGANSAALMNELGDILNGMDAATEADEWTSPVFEQARKLWPTV